MPQDYSTLLARHRADVSDAMFSAVRRLRWSPEKLAADRERRLRELLTVAMARSPFHRDRLAGIDPATFTEAELSSLPTMTKVDMMANFDDVVTDPALTLAAVEGHLAGLDGDAYLFDKYRAVVTGGSSGNRGVFVYGWDDWTNLVVIDGRWQVRRGETAVPGAKVASTFSAETAHISGALQAFTRNPDGPILHLPVNLPLSDVVAGLNAAQPQALHGYPTSIGLFVAEARSGRLKIAPMHIYTCGEMLTNDIRDGARETWGAEIQDQWGASEGIYANSCGTDDMLHLPDDLTIVEGVDAGGNPVAPGQPADKVFLTNLYNMTQPLIRYVLTDAMTVYDEPCACGSAHRRIGKLRGRRLDDTLVYSGGLVVHVLGLYSAMLRHRHIVEYQISQTATGASVVVRTESGADLVALCNDLVDALTADGLPNPEVTVAKADALDRLWSGKLRHFVPLPKLYRAA